jgi:hypothetical protein
VSFLFFSPNAIPIDLPVCTTALAILPIFEVHDEVRPVGIGVWFDSEHDDEMRSSVVEMTGEREISL